MNRRTFSLSRRTLLRGGVGVAVGLPWLEIIWDHRPARAQMAPARYVTIFGENGFIRRRFFPMGGETDFVLGEALQPHASYRNNMIVLEGITNKALTGQFAVNTHYDAFGCALTGSKTTNVTGSLTRACASSISMDQYMAKMLPEKTRFATLEFIVGGRSGEASISSLGSKQPVPFEGDPQKLFDRIFTGVQPSGSMTSGPNPELVKLREDRKSVLDTVQANYALVQKRLGKADRTRLEAHIATVRDIENRLQAAPVTTASAGCTVPQRPPSSSSDSTLRTEYMDLIAYAFSCDLTRIVSIASKGPGFWGVPSVVPFSSSYHDGNVHNTPSSAESAEVVHKTKTWEQGRVKLFLDKLAAIKEGPGTVFDNTLVLYGDEYMDGYAHSVKNMAYLLFCGSQRFFKMGRYLKYPNDQRTTNELLLAIMSKFGVSAGGGHMSGGWGDPQFGTAPLPGL